MLAFNACSRQLAPAAAAARHRALLEARHGSGRALFKKIDSTLRGPIADAAYLRDFLRERLPAQAALHLLPGDVLDVGSGTAVRDPRWQDFRYGDTADYLAAYAERRAGEVAAVWAATADACDSPSWWAIAVSERAPAIDAGCASLIRSKVTISGSTRSSGRGACSASTSGA